MLDIWKNYTLTKFWLHYICFIIAWLFRTSGRIALFCWILPLGYACGPSICVHLSNICQKNYILTKLLTMLNVQHYLNWFVYIWHNSFFLLHCTTDIPCILRSYYKYISSDLLHFWVHLKYICMYKLCMQDLACFYFWMNARYITICIICTHAYFKIQMFMLFKNHEWK